MKRQPSDFNPLRHKHIHPGIAVLFLGAAIACLGCEAEVEKIEAFATSESLPVMVAEDFETTFIDSFQVQFYMKAPVLQKFETGSQPFVEFPKGILLMKYDEQGNTISRITSDYARNYEEEKKWEAKNNVVAVNEQGDTLKTEYLIWEEQTGKIYSDSYVKIIRPDQIITGIGFEADQNFQNWKIRNPKGTIYVTVNQNENEQVNRK